MNDLRFAREFESNLILNISVKPAIAGIQDFLLCSEFSNDIPYLFDFNESKLIKQKFSTKRLENQSFSNETSWVEDQRFNAESLLSKGGEGKQYL